MNIRKSFKNLTQKFSKKTALTALVVMAGLSFGLGLAHAEFYPARPTYDYNKLPVNGTNCTDADKAAYNRCGSLTGPVFNSFINTPSYGDERAFLDGRRSDKATNTNADQINDVTNGSREVVIRMYVHNNANQTTNASGLGVAKNTKVRIALPTATSQVLRARGYISADNAAQVEDTTDMVGAQNFSVSYVPGSAKAMRGTSTYALSDNIVTTGALIGDQVMNGNLPGCFEYAVLVEVTVKINVSETPEIGVTKQVRKHIEGQTGNWGEEVTVKPGETVDYLINTKNTGKANLTDVVTRDVLPPHIQLVPGTVKFYKGNGNQVLSDGPLFDGGFNSGLYNPGNNTMITFSAKALSDFESCEVRIRNIAYAKAAKTNEVQDTADVIVKKDNCVPTKPIYSCDSLSATKIGERKVRLDLAYTAKNGATFKNATYDFGDNTTPLVTNRTQVEHTYSADGNYVASVAVTFTVDGKDVTVSGDNCAARVTLTTPEDKCPIPGKEHLPKDSPDCKEVPVTPELPKTGTGSLVGLFTIVTLAAAAAHNLISRRTI